MRWNWIIVTICVGTAIAQTPSDRHGPPTTAVKIEDVKPKLLAMRAQIQSEQAKVDGLQSLFQKQKDAVIDRFDDVQSNKQLRADLAAAQKQYDATRSLGGADPQRLDAASRLGKMKLAFDDAQKKFVANDAAFQKTKFDFDGENAHLITLEKTFDEASIQWYPIPGAPEPMLEWVKDQPALHRAWANELNSDIDDSQHQIDSLQQNIQALQNQPPPTIARTEQYLGGQTGHSSIPDQAKINQRTKDLAAMRQSLKDAQIAIGAAKSEQTRRSSDTSLVIGELVPVVGDFGRISGPVRIIQVIDSHTAIVEYLDKWIWLSEIDTSRATDDQKTTVDFTVQITGTKSYTTVLNAQRTILAGEKIDPYQWVKQGKDLLEE